MTTDNPLLPELKNVCWPICHDQGDFLAVGISVNDLRKIYELAERSVTAVPDVDALKREPAPGSVDEFNNGYDRGWNAAIDHLQAQGYLRQGWLPIETHDRESKVLLYFK